MKTLRITNISSDYDDELSCMRKRATDIDISDFTDDEIKTIGKFMDRIAMNCRIYAITGISIKCEEWSNREHIQY